MTRGTALHLSILLFTAASCGGSSSAAGPAAPTCSTAQATPLTLAVGAYTALDPAADAGCVTFPANASTIDSAEYLIVPQSAAPIFGESSPFALRPVTLGPVAPLTAQSLSSPGSPRSIAVQFDGFLRHLGQTRPFGAGRRCHPPRHLPPQGCRNPPGHQPRGACGHSPSARRSIAASSPR